MQYWRSTEQLQGFARDSLLPHLAAWHMFNRRVGFTGDVGFWHQKYVVWPGQYETGYGNMPRFGLAVAGQHLPVWGGKASRRPTGCALQPTCQPARRAWSG